jgi:hypothetical protein
VEEIYGSEPLPWSRPRDLYFTSSPRARKARNLAANPACTVSVRLEGIDLVLEGEAARVTDPPPWHLYRFRFHTAFGVATAEPAGATRWRFGG